MDAFLVSQAAFWWARIKIDPKLVLDKVIEYYVDMVVPPRESNTTRNKGIFGSIVNSWNSLERSAEKLDRENEIRRGLRQWDRENPECTIDMIIRTVVPGLVSVIATQVYVSFCRRIRHQRY